VPFAIFSSQQKPDLGTYTRAPWWTRAASIQSTYPGTNQSEGDYRSRSGLAIYSDYGQRFRNAIMHRSTPAALRTKPQMQKVGAQNQPGSAGPQGTRFRDSTGVVIREMMPLLRAPYGQHNGYQDFIGAFAARAAYIIPVVAGIRYQGQLPTSQQPIIPKANPWDDPTRGRP
jgi:hypothetical protein